MVIKAKNDLIKDKKMTKYDYCRADTLADGDLGGI